MATQQHLGKEYGYAGNRWLIDTQKDMNILPVRRGCYNVGVQLLAVRILQAKRTMVSKTPTVVDQPVIPPVVVRDGATNKPEKPTAAAITTYRKDPPNTATRPVFVKTSIGQIYHVSLESHTLHSTTFLSKGYAVHALCSYVIGRDDRVTAVREYKQPLEYFKINFQHSDSLELSLRNYKGDKVPCHIQMLVELNEL